MFKCRIKTFILLLVLIIGYAISFLPLLMVQSFLEFDQFIRALLFWLLIVLASLPFFLRYLVRRAWFIQSGNEFLPLTSLEKQLMAINSYNSPVIVRKKRKILIVGWRYNEPEWSERMAIKGIKKSYFAKLVFDQTTKTVNMSDRIKYVNFDLSPIRVRSSWMFRPRLYCSVRIKPDKDILLFKEQKAEQYHFRPQEIKTPLCNTFIKNGWNVRFDLF